MKLKYKKEVRFCEACGGAGMGCPYCEHGLVEEIIIIRPEKGETKSRPCNCGSGEDWASCRANSPYCG